MTGLTATGILSYNGFVFDGAISIDVVVEKERDDAQRTVIYERHRITVSAIVALTPTDLSMENIRKKLARDGGILIFQNKGFGTDLVVNKTAAQRDVKWGPKTEILSWTPIGDNNAAEITWTVTVCLPACGELFTKHSGIMASNYSVVYSINKHGDTTRKISGYLEIAQTWLGNAAPGTNRNIPDSADLYRRFIDPEPPRGFSREQEYNTSLDKSRLDFTITDTQVPSRNPYPEGVTGISGTHRVSWRRSGGAAKFRNTLSVDITSLDDVGPTQAWLIFLTIVRQRINKARQRGRGVLLDELEVEEDLFGRPVSFQAGWRVMTCVSSFLKDTGLFEPLGTDWDDWQRSIQNTSFNIRGSAGLIHLPGEDAIVDLCFAKPTITKDLVEPSPRDSASKPTLANETPPEEESWIDYRSDVVTGRERPVVRQSIIQPSDSDRGISDQNKSSPLDYGPAGGIPDILQLGGRSRYFATLFGRAIRAGHKIPRPKLVTVGGQEAVELTSKFAQRALGNFFGVPVYSAAWSIAYAMSNSPGQVQPTDNLKECIDGDTGEAKQPEL